jgi:hypothetical protein
MQLFAKTHSLMKPILIRFRQNAFAKVFTKIFVFAKRNFLQKIAHFRLVFSFFAKIKNNKQQDKLGVLRKIWHLLTPFLSNGPVTGSDVLPPIKKNLKQTKN